MTFAVRSIILSALALGAASLVASDDLTGAPYTDPNTGISFLSYADTTGYRFGLTMPPNPTTDFIVQLVSPLQSGAGWAGIDFGPSMTNKLMVVAWPQGNEVIISPRIATGYEVADTVLYSAAGLKLSPIPRGTFVNGTHVSATFVCGGCINGDSFAALTTATGHFGWGYSTIAVRNPADPSTLLSDHSACCPYGAIPVTFAQAQLSKYAAWAAMAGSSNATSAAGSGASSAANSGSSGSSSGSSSSGSGSSSVIEEGYPSAAMGPAGVLALVFVGFLYLLQGFSFF